MLHPTHTTVKPTTSNIDLAPCCCTLSLATAPATTWPALMLALLSLQRQPAAAEITWELLCMWPTCTGLADEASQETGTLPAWLLASRPIVQALMVAVFTHTRPRSLSPHLQQRVDGIVTDVRGITSSHMCHHFWSIGHPWLPCAPGGAALLLVLRCAPAPAAHVLDLLVMDRLQQMLCGVCYDTLSSLQAATVTSACVPLHVLQAIENMSVLQQHENPLAHHTSGISSMSPQDQAAAHNLRVSVSLGCCQYYPSFRHHWEPCGIVHLQKLSCVHTAGHLQVWGWLCAMYAAHAACRQSVPPFC